VALLAVLVSLAACPVVGTVGGRVCEPTGCFGGACAGTPVEFEALDLPIMRWGVQGYTHAGSMKAYSLTEDDFSIFLHGPLWRPKQRKPEDFAPPLYISGTLVDKIWRLEDFRAKPTPEGTIITANMKFVSWAVAPSTMYPVPPMHEGGPERYLVAEGNPFLVNPGNHTTSMWLGGVDLVDEQKCTTIFPADTLGKMTGKVVNTVECHASGFCFFSVWKFYDDTLPSEDDCLYWCRVSTLNDPTSCMMSGVVRDERGEQICHVDGKGAVHGLTIGKTDPENECVFDLFLLFTGKGTFDAGDSSIYKLRMEVSRDGLEATSVRTLQREPWGAELWQKSVQAPHDVGVDHAWIDDDGRHVWVGTFREMNDGVHMLDYDTGELIHSIQGISSILPGKYSYTSGIKGIGAWGKPGSLLAIATCEKFGEQFMGGRSAIVLVDISSSGQTNGTSAGGGSNGGSNGGSWNAENSRVADMTFVV